MGSDLFLDCCFAECSTACLQGNGSPEVANIAGTNMLKEKIEEDAGTIESRTRLKLYFNLKLVFLVFYFKLNRGCGIDRNGHATIDNCNLTSCFNLLCKIP